jgi:NADH-quinone oxidoreductase subunit E
MAVRRLAEEQPEHFAFTPDNLAWAEKEIAKYPAGRQASAVIALLWRAQEQHNGWLPEPAIRLVAEMLEMPTIRVLEVATFYTMFQLAPVGRKAHVQVCGTTPCMLRGAEGIKAVCKKKIADNPHQLSEDGDFSWEEVECLGACVNAPMVQIFKDTYEDLTPESFEGLLDDIAKGKPVTPGPQNGRHFSVPQEGLTSLQSLKNAGDAGGKPMPQIVNGAEAAIYSVAGYAINDNHTLSRGKASKQSDHEVSNPVLQQYDVTEKPIKKAEPKTSPATSKAAQEQAGRPSGQGRPEEEAARIKAPSRKNEAAKPSLDDASRPEALNAPRNGKADDLQAIKGVGPKIETVLNELGIYHYEQIAAWTEDNKSWVNDYLRFKGRIDREQWVAQAVKLAKP